MARGLAIVALTAVALAGPLAGSAAAAKLYHSSWYSFQWQCLAAQKGYSNSHIGIVKPCYPVMISFVPHFDPIDPFWRFDFMV
jgi:hypothetical protein